MVGTSVRRRPPDRKAQIARAAATCFGAAGYHGAGIDDVAAAVGITGGAVYRHFGNKYELLHRAMFDGIGLFETAAAPQPNETLSDLLGRLAELAIERRDLGVLLQRESRHLEPEDQAELRRRLRSVASRITKLLHADRPRVSKDDSSLLVRSMFAVLASPSYQRVTLPEGGGEAVLGSMLDVVARSGGNSSPNERAIASRTHGDGPVSGAGVAGARRCSRLRASSSPAAGTRRCAWRTWARRPGIAGPSIYQHFDSKAELLTAALTRGAEWLQFGLSRALAAADSESHALELVVGAYTEFVLEQPDLMAVLLTEITNLRDDQRHAVRRLQHDYVAEWVRLVQAVRPGCTDPEARFLTQGVLGIVNDNARSTRARQRPNLHAVLSHLGLEVLYA